MLPGLMIVVMSFSYSAIQAADEDILGVWVTRTDDGTKGGLTIVAKFTKDGELIVRHQAGGNEITVTGTYKIEKEQLSSSRGILDTRVRDDVATIKELTMERLVLVVAQRIKDKDGQEKDVARQLIFKKN